MRYMTVRISSLAGFLLVVTTTFVGMGPTQAASKPSIVKATFAKEVTSDFVAKNPSTTFMGNETVNLLLEFKGRPKTGKVTADWRFRTEQVATTAVEFSSVKGGLFSRGGNTFVKFNLTPGKQKLPLGEFEVTVAVDGTKLKTYKFEVVGPKGSTPTKVTKVVLVRGINNADSSPAGPATNTFGPTEEVFISFLGDFGIDSWIEVQWTVGSKVDPAGTKSVTLQENLTQTYGYFSFLPKGGWPTGSHKATLVVNSKVIGTYAFTVK